MSGNRCSRLFIVCSCYAAAGSNTGGCQQCGPAMTTRGKGSGKKEDCGKARQAWCCRESCCSISQHMSSAALLSCAAPTLPGALAQGGVLQYMHCLA
jgi:hypothetical protein